jgi:hypothetical protein
LKLPLEVQRKDNPTGGTDHAKKHDSRAAKMETGTRIWA